MAFEFFVLFFLFLAMMAWVLAPLFSVEMSSEAIQNELQKLSHSKQKLLEEFRDLEFDYQLKKMSDLDYQEQRKAVLQELQNIYDKLDNLKEANEQSEQLA